MAELLAPAGDMERLKIALLYGADAVYIGGNRFSLRANAHNFSDEEIKQAINYAHNLNKKVYVTVNILFHNSEINGLDDYLLYLDSINVDGIIASDILVLKNIQKLKLKVKVILSTQASVTNYYGALFYQKLGVKQVVMAREAFKEDIIAIKEKTDLEVECFIHGAMCSSISGKCILSNYVTGRDSNRGGCAQICRWSFNADENFTITAKDLNMLDYIEDMLKIGVDTFKVEGRMRSIYYIATIILCYRRVIDKILSNSLTEEDKKYYLKILNRCANRDSSAQFYLDYPNENDQYYNLDSEQSNQDFLGLVINFDKERMLATIEERNYFKVGDKVQFIGPNIKTFSMTIDKIYDENDTEIKVANKPKTLVKIKTEQVLHPFDILRVNIF